MTENMESGITDLELIHSCMTTVTMIRNTMGKKNATHTSTQITWQYTTTPHNVVSSTPSKSSSSIDKVSMLPGLASLLILVSTSDTNTEDEPPSPSPFFFRTSRGAGGGTSDVNSRAEPVEKVELLEDSLLSEPLGL